MPTYSVPTLLRHVRRLAAAERPDEQLLQEFVSRRSGEAFAAILARHGPMVLNVCRRALRDAHAAEDVFQSTFLVLADRASSIRHRASLAGFLHGVAYRLATRARRRAASPLPAEVADDAAAPADGLAWKEMLAILDEELSRLPDRLRSPLALCYLQGQTQDEAARQLGWGLNTLRRRLDEGRKLLEARLRGRGVSLPGAMAGLLAGGAAAVPGSLRAATLEAVSGSAVLHSGLSRKALALAAVMLFGTAVCFGYFALRPDAPPAAAAPVAAQAALRLGTDRYRYGVRVVSFATSADGRLAIASGASRSFSPARVFDLTDGRCLHTLPQGGELGTEAVGLSPDGKTLAVKCNAHVYFLDAATGKELRRCKYQGEGGSRSVTDWLTFSPDGKLLAATTMGDAVQLIDVEMARVVRSMTMGGAASAVAFSPDGRVVATAGYDLVDKVYHARLWEVATGKELRRFPAARFPTGNGGMRALAFSADGKRLAGGGWGDARLRVWDVESGKEPVEFPKTGDEVASVAFSPDGKTVASASDRVYLYDAATGKELLRIDRRARGLSFAGSVLTGAVSGAIYRWDAATGRRLTPAGQDSTVEQIVAAGAKMFTVGQDGDLLEWGAAGEPRLVAGEAHRGAVASSDGRYLAWCDKHIHGGSRIRLYEVAKGRFLERFPILSDDAAVEGFTPDGKALLTLDRDGATVRLWDVESGKERRTFAANEPKKPTLRGGLQGLNRPYFSRRAALSPDGKTLAVGVVDDDRVRLWDVATGKVVVEIKARLASVHSAADQIDRVSFLGAGVRWMTGYLGSGNGLAFSPDGRLVATWSESPFQKSNTDHAAIWDAATGRLVVKLPVGAGSAAFAPDGRTFATASAGGVIRVWETASWSVRAEHRGHRDRVTALAFGPDGRLYTGGLDTVVLGRDARPQVATNGTFAEAWEALASSDAKAAHAAQGRFLAEPAKAVEWLATRLRPAVPPAPARVKALIADLDSNDFATRARATENLKELWPATEEALREVAAKADSLEARRRAERLVREMEKAITPAGALRALRAAEALEWLATEPARVHLSELAKGAPDARLTRETAAAVKRLAGRR